MVGVEIVVGYVAAWVWRKARKAAPHADEAMDAVLESGIERLQRLVVDKLDGDPALRQLEKEAADSSELPAVALSDRTRQRVLLAIEEEVEADDDFRTRLMDALADVQQAQRAAGATMIKIEGEGAIGAAGDITGVASTGANAINIQTR